jgi:phospholipid/cholesterol/gamma-HCH transport system permease protein
MKMNQEIDAMDVMGVDPFEALVVPRFIAMQLMFPLLTFVRSSPGSAAGLIVCWLVLDLSPVFFFQRLLNNVGVPPLGGLAKAPGVRRRSSPRSAPAGLQVGRRRREPRPAVTAAVVQAIFAIIASMRCSP